MYLLLKHDVLILWIAFLIQMGNKGAFIRFTAPEMKPDIVTFSAVVSITLFFCIFIIGVKVGWLGDVRVLPEIRSKWFRDQTDQG